MSETRIGQTVADWQPIETAPKDGTNLLLLVPYSDTPVVGSWCRSRWAAGREHLTVDCMQYCYGGLVASEDIAPTHWAYLPPPPEVR